MDKQQQSPIDIQSPIVTTYVNPLQIRWSQNPKCSLKTQGGKVEVVFSGDVKEKVSFDGRSFYLWQFHFHHKSEHWISGKQFPLELHIVHQNCDPSDGGLAVLGVMIKADNSANRIPALVEAIEMTCKHDSCEKLEIETNPNEWLPPEPELYYRYEGSLTTPDFDETVSWVVFKEPLGLPRKEINRLIRFAAKPARLPQPLHRRFVLANFS